MNDSMPSRNYAIKIKTVASDKAEDILSNSILKDDKEANINTAALSAITGKIVSISLLNCNDNADSVLHFIGEEKEILKKFWDFVSTEYQPATGISLISWFGNTFDFPFIYQRTIINRIKTRTVFSPMESLNTFNQNKGINKLIDLGKLWSCNKFYIKNNNLYDVGYACDIIPKEIYKAISVKDQIELSNDLSDSKNVEAAKAIIKTELILIKTLFHLLV